MAEDDFISTDHLQGVVARLNLAHPGKKPLGVWVLSIALLPPHCPDGREKTYWIVKFDETLQGSIFLTVERQGQSVNVTEHPRRFYGTNGGGEFWVPQGTWSGGGVLWVLHPVPNGVYLSEDGPGPAEEVLLYDQTELFRQTKAWRDAVEAQLKGLNFARKMEFSKASSDKVRQVLDRDRPQETIVDLDF